MLHGSTSVVWLMGRSFPALLSVAITLVKVNLGLTTTTLNFVPELFTVDDVFACCGMASILLLMESCLNGVL